MVYVVLLEADRHFTVPLKNVANTPEDNARIRAVLRRDVRTWLNLHAPTVAVVLQRFQYDGDGRDFFEWIGSIDFEPIQYTCWLEFDNPGEAVMFKLRWL